MQSHVGVSIMGRVPLENAWHRYFVQRAEVGAGGVQHSALIAAPPSWATPAMACRSDLPVNL
jgi:hypothetical protein